MTKEEIKMRERIEVAERAIQMNKKLIIWDRDGIWILSIIAVISSAISLICWFVAG